jgi:hypothetical protein
MVAAGVPDSRPDHADVLCSLSLSMHEALETTVAASEDELRQQLGLLGRTTGKGKIPRSSLASRPVELFMCSVLKQTG